MTEIYLHFLFAHYGLYGNAPVGAVLHSRPVALYGLLPICIIRLLSVVLSNLLRITNALVIQHAGELAELKKILAVDPENVMCACSLGRLHQYHTFRVSVHAAHKMFGWTSLTGIYTYTFKQRTHVRMTGATPLIHLLRLDTKTATRKRLWSCCVC